ncbi:MAG: 16S rRNA (adenine(1518)-N(6)/adenine(1519)-N(6))-dimethyltransferase RsmA [Treponema sp.]|nr:16S rRNA (adenine(1518)-N(6)/adenine(1519)-N(6))-dimethyltransferase RsmA [Treponema sp.]MCL2237286.1 16S rRNA (adenine(1518)-N(6)/adenine(1519)-N(6))-dimethyltransferase RsmA [Treponema sp.]
MMPNYNSAAELRAFLEKEGLGMRKKFGQNFLINPKTRQSLVDALGAKPGCEVWEIGPGLGAMTDMLLKNDLRVKAFEIDNGFIRVLKEIFCDNKNFNLVEGDVLKTWKNETSNDSLNETFLFGNLPYNIAAVLLADFIEKGKTFSRIVVTVQKEVALRMAASAGSSDYSSFSVLCASAYKVKPLSVIKRESFYPQPNVDSMGVLLERSSPQEMPSGFFRLVRALFASRRKTVKNNLTAFLSSRFGKVQSQQLCADVLRENAISENERAENLDFNAFLSLAKSIENVRI